MIDIKSENILFSINPMQIVKDRLVMGSNYYATGPEGIVAEITPTINEFPDGFVYLTQFCDYHRLRIDFRDDIPEKPKQSFRMELKDIWYSDERSTGPGDGHYAIYKIIDNEIFKIDDKWEINSEGQRHHQYTVGERTEHFLFMDAPYRDLQLQWQLVDYAIKFKTMVQYSYSNEINVDVNLLITFDWGIHAIAQQTVDWQIKGESSFTSEQEVRNSILVDLHLPGHYPNKNLRLGRTFEKEWRKYILENT